MGSTPWFPLTQHALTFLSSLSLLFPSLHLLPPSRFAKMVTSLLHPPLSRRLLIRRVATTGMAAQAALVHKSTSPSRRVATGGMAAQDTPVTKSTSPTRVATECMAAQAAPVQKSTWPPRPVATAGYAHPAAPVPHAAQAHTSTAIPAHPHGRPGRPGAQVDLADQAGCHRGHGRPGRPGAKVDLADQAGCHRGRCRPGRPGASRRPGALNQPSRHFQCSFRGSIHARMGD